MKSFVNFMRKEGVVGLAAGFVLGGAVSKLIENFVVGVVDPLVASVFNTTAYVNKSSIIGDGADAVVVNWGPSVVLLVNVVIVTLVVWGLARWLGVIKSEKKSK